MKGLAASEPTPNGGEAMAALAARRDWSQTPLGSRDGWPTALRMAVDLALASRQPMQVAWGPQLTTLYNDAFVPIYGSKHPDALGKPFVELWEEAWETIGPLVQAVLQGRSQWAEEMVLPLRGRGERVWSWLGLSLTPLRDGRGSVVGFFCVAVETTGKRLLQREITVASERLQGLFGQAPGFVAILRGPEHVFEFVNQAYERLVGERHVLGRPVRDAVPELTGQGFTELLDRVYRSGQRHAASHVEVRLHDAAGQANQHYLDFVCAPTLNDQGEVTGLFVQGHDVTETVLAQQVVDADARRQAFLLELAERLRESVDVADLSFAAGDVLGRALGLSRAGYGSVDPGAETVTVARAWTAVGVTSVEGTLHFRQYGSFIDDLKQGRTVVVADARADPRTVAGIDRLTALKAISMVNVPIIEQGNFVALLYANDARPRLWTSEELGFIREVGERTRAVLERRRAERELRALAQSLERQVEERTAERDRVWANSRDLLAVVGHDGVFRRVNPAWRSILGHDPERVAGSHFIDYVWPGDVERTRRALHQGIRCDLTGFENRYCTRDGEARWISWHTSAEGDLVYAYGRDVTAEKAQAEALRQAQELLLQAQKMEAVGQLTGGIAHDFNNLLVGIIGGLDMLETRLAQGRTGELGRYLDAVRGAGQRAASLTHRLLAFSRRQTLDPRPVDLNRLVSGLEELLRRTVGPEIQVEVVCAADLWTTRADPHQLENALLNLCINARDAMPEGGRVRVETCNRELDREAAGGRGMPPGAYVAMCVSDTGTGMSQDTIARAFDPFFTTKPLGSGTGLGLSMIYGFAKQSGGQVRIHSVEGQGTTVCLYLPRHRGALPAAPPVQAAPAPVGARSGETIVLVDDEPTVRMLATEALEDRGYRIIAASSGAEALGVLHSDAHVDLLVSDVGLPGGINGRQLADAARLVRPGLKVLFITGYAQAGMAADGDLEPGMQVLTKPFPIQELATRVDQVIDGSPHPG